MQGMTLPRADRDNTPCKARRDHVQIMTSPHANCPDFIPKGKLTYPYPYKGGRVVGIPPPLHPTTPIHTCAVLYPTSDPSLRPIVQPQPPSSSLPADTPSPFRHQIRSTRLWFTFRPESLSRAILRR